MDFDIFTEKAHDINELLNLIVDKSIEFSQCERVILYLFDKEEQLLFNRAGQGVEVMELNFKIGEGIPGQALDKHKTIIIQDVESDTHYDAKIDDVTDVQVKSMLVSPIIDSNNKKLGVIQLINKPEPFNNGDVVFVESMCAQASIAIDNTLLFNSLQQLREREQALAEQIKEQNVKLQDAYMKVEEENKEVMESSEKVGRARTIAMVCAIVLFTLIGGYIWYTNTGAAAIDVAEQDAELTDDFANLDFDAIAAEVAGGGAVVKGGSLSEDGKIYTAGVTELNSPITLSGNLEPATIYNVFAPFSGRIISKNFVIGEEIDKGQEILKISPEKIEVDYRNAKISELNAREDFEDLQNWENSKELADARQEVIKARDEVETLQKLFDLGIVSEQNLDNAKDTLLNKEQKLEGVEEKGDEKNLQVAEFKLKNASLNERDLKKKLNKAIIRAKMDGVAMKPVTTGGGSNRKDKPIEPGIEIDEGTVFLAIANIEKLRVLGRVDETDIATVKQGQDVEITGQAFPGVILNGKVVYISSEARTDSRKPYFEIRVETEELTPEQRKVVRIGMSATLSIVTYTNPEAILLPFGVIKIERGGNFVFKVVPGEQEPQKVAISTGVSTPSAIEVTSGVSPGDKLLVIN